MTDWQPARCDHCGAFLTRPPRPDGVPRWCQQPACKAARVRWLYANDPAYAESQRAYTRWLRSGRHGQAPRRRTVFRCPSTPRLVLRNGRPNPLLADVQALHARGLSERQIARQLGMSRSGIYRYLHQEVST